MLGVAFAVQASVEPDILIVDEALGVGDIFFRQKCFQRLEELRSRVVSILVVSHAMMDVEQFCQRALLLNAGEELFQGSSSEAVKRYYLLEQHDRIPMSLQESVARPAELASTRLGQQEFFWPAPEAFLDIS